MNAETIKNIGEIWAVVIAVSSILIKFIIPKLPAGSKWLGIVKFIGSWLALNNNVTDADRPKV
jgi:hypothetical protein